MAFQVKLDTETAKVPTRFSEFCAGYDLYSDADVILHARSRCMVSSGISISIPENTYAKIAPRSGLTVKNGIDVGAGIVDFDFRDTVKIVLFNHSDEDYKIETGDRIAQLILHRIETPEITVVDKLTETKRGFGGFGSTGR